MPYTQRFLLGFCAGAMVLAVPWVAPPELVRWAIAGGFVSSVAAVVAAVGAASGTRARRLAWIGAPLGLMWSALAHDAALNLRLDAGEAHTTVTFEGRLISDPVHIETGRGGPPGKRFQVRVLRRISGSLDVDGRRLRLSWYGAPAVSRGEVWRWTATVHGPWSYANPGGFDYERWLLAAGLQGTGYIRRGERLEPASPGLVSHARTELAALVRRLDLPYGGVLLALLVGHGTGITDDQWDVLRATGTVHLMVISGLHVSLAAALGFAVGRWAGRLYPGLLLWLDAPSAGCLAGSLVAAAYVLLAGAGLPALRAVVMTWAVLWLLAGGRTARLGGPLLLALALLLAAQPLAVHQQGFWLSFGAVMILYLALGHGHGDGRVKRLVRAQLALSLGMLPMVAFTTGSLPWSGLAANLVAVPVMSLLVVPAALLGALLAGVSSTAAGWMLTLADWMVGAVLAWLTWLARVPALPAPGGGVALLVAQSGALCWVLGVPRTLLPGLALCCVLPFAALPTGIAHGAYRVMALDVGQGTAVVVDTRTHRLLFDAGPAFPGGFETGSAVVVPSVVATGPPRLEALILSHDDIDHVGGARVVRTMLAPRMLLGSMPGTEPCSARRWRWDGVSFELLEVQRPPHSTDNDRSCVLLVDDGHHAMLVAGDVSARVEARLLRVLAQGTARVHLMFAPHHGSGSSSSRAFVRVLQPRLVLVSAGRGNKFGHPHPEVVARYRRVGARVHQTGREGALVWHSADPQRLVRWRVDRSPYWRSREEGGRSSSR